MRFNVKPLFVECLYHKDYLSYNEYFYFIAVSNDLSIHGFCMQQRRIRGIGPVSMETAEI